MGGSEITLPEVLLGRMGVVSLATLDFYWVGGRHYFAISHQPLDRRKPAIKFTVVIRDGVVVDFYEKRFQTQKSLRTEFPEIFKGTYRYKSETENVEEGDVVQPATAVDSKAKGDKKSKP